MSYVFCQVIIAKNTQVTPRCGSQLISIELNFDPTQLPGGKFTDWIIVGVSGKPECRLRGNGETKYIIEIAVFNDPCLTQIPAQNVFQNRIRIGKNPVVILEKDQSITVKCVYGLPTIETMTLPVINSNFNVDNFAFSNHSEQFSTNSPSEANFNIDESSNRHQLLENRESLDALQKESKITDQLSPTQQINPEQFSTVMFGSNQVPTNEWIGRNTLAPNSENRNRDRDITQTGFENTPETNSNQNGLTANEKIKKRSFSTIFIAAVVLIVFLFLALLAFSLICLRRKLANRNQSLLMDRISDRTWRANTSNDEYGSTPPTLSGRPGVSDQKSPYSMAAIGKELLRTPGRNFDASSTVNKPYNAVNDNGKSTSRTHSAMKMAKKNSPAPHPNLPLKSNLEEFVSKTYALGEYNNLASPAYAYTSDVHDEREVDVGTESRYEKPYEKRNSGKRKPSAVEEGAVSSFRSITEIVHAAETATLAKEVRGVENSTRLQNLLMDSVLSIRGFGYRKLTEQEIIRWKNLIQQDSRIRELLADSKSSAEIENIFEHDEYKNMFTSSKWHEIAICVHRALTNSLDRTNSRSELQLFVGNVQTEW
ncbi:hypothetical protein L5515_016147 [Caenorhabditis briggsae]|uniref:ZP domain-containing protein n=1 Tax=Caenorhabditis briggsae TaxID=6238 RepID=A0AAE9FAF4_CAEBR|nr:hypothetical protein L5515_016147 [Caenorhabditis briggsae]